MNMATYNLIGKAYSLVEEKEPWLNNAVNLADIAVLSAEAITGDRDVKADTGANRMLLENNRLYNFIDGTMDFSAYKLLVLPDVEIEDDAIIEKIKAKNAPNGYDEDNYVSCSCLDEDFVSETVAE